MGFRTTYRVIATLLAAITGAVLLSGSDQPVTARPSPPWQRLAARTFSPRTDALAVPVGHRVLFLGGRRGSTIVRSGVSYDLRTGIEQRLRAPVPLTGHDRAVTAGALVVLRCVRHGRHASWWRYDPRRRTWTRMRHLPPDLSHPSSFASEVYALSGRRVVVYSAQLDRWTRLPADPLRPLLRPRAVTASRAGTVVAGYAGRGTHAFVDRWNGLRWRRHRARPMASAHESLPPGVRARGATVVAVGGRSLVLQGDRAWIHTP